MATGTALCVPSASINSQGNQKTPGREGRTNPSGSSLASETLVYGPQSSFSDNTLAHTRQSDCSQSGRSHPSRTSVVTTHRLAIERDILAGLNIPPDAVPTIQAARRPSTKRIYQFTWKAFSMWCSKRPISPRNPDLSHIIGFLQEGLTSGLSPNTLRRQVAALSSVLTFSSSESLAKDPVIRLFLRGASNLHPPTIHRYPSWNLNKVLNTLMRAPFEPLREASLRLLTFKVAFLIAITSARRISELAALSTRKDLCIFHLDRVVLRLDPTFVPKVNSLFHRSQELILPNFCPVPRHQKEHEWHTLDVRRALKIYLHRTSPFRKTEALLVSFQPSSLGSKVSGPTIGRWIRATIAMTYDLQSLPRPKNITAHSTRSASTSAAWATQAPLEEVCRAATWSSPSPFIRHYKLDTYASAEASFGRRVLQSVHDNP
ncbi:uncharacterized protein LOC131200588 [Ahaetulla prasina]|uniref:uncharacterized protein LOC131200588 n=1 Tax=Ahaetulla prasina TaxID=499056 RepID=UPI0026486DEC|nr:uncharacterized protein LOC131200588 [Ahaetulla prasina]